VLLYGLILNRCRYITISADHKSASDSNKLFTPQPEEDTVVSKHLARLGCTGHIPIESARKTVILVNHLRPNDHYKGRTAQLTSRCFILYIYSTKIHTEYFKHAA